MSSANSVTYFKQLTGNLLTTRIIHSSHWRREEKDCNFDHYNDGDIDDDEIISVPVHFTFLSSFSLHKFLYSHTLIY